MYTGWAGIHSTTEQILCQKIRKTFGRTFSFYLGLDFRGSRRQGLFIGWLSILLPRLSPRSRQCLQTLFIAWLKQYKEFW